MNKICFVIAVVFIPLSQVASGQTKPESLATAASANENVTYSRDIAQIIFDKCVNCHRPGQVGPFALLTYDDVKRHSSTIAAVVENGYMPPWKPVNENVKYSNDRSLTSEQKEKLLKWIANGLPSGNLEQAPAAPKFSDGWSLGTPDLVVKMNGQFEVPAEGRDIYRSFVFLLNLPEDKWIKAIELRPTAKGTVHHALFFLDTSGEARKKDGIDGKAGIPGMGFLADFGGAAGQNVVGGGGLLNRLRGRNSKKSGGDSGAEPTSEQGRIDGALARGLGGYVPGAIPTRLPGDLAMHLPKGADIVMQTHFHPTGKREVEQAELAIYFAEQAPSRQLVTIQVPAMFGFGAGIDIPAGDKNFKITDSFTLPIDVQAISIGGHAHYICKTMKMIARTPQGSEIALMTIGIWIGRIDIFSPARLIFPPERSLKLKSSTTTPQTTRKTLISHLSEFVGAENRTMKWEAFPYWSWPQMNLSAPNCKPRSASSSTRQSHPDF